MDKSIKDAIDRLKRLNNKEYKLKVYIPLEAGAQYTAFASQIVDDLILKDKELLANQYINEHGGS